MNGGYGWWSPTENKAAMKAFVDHVRGRRGIDRKRSWPRLLLEALGVVGVAVGIFLLITRLI